MHLKDVGIATLVIAIVAVIIIAVIVFHHKYKTEEEREHNRDKLFWWIGIGIAAVIGLALLGAFSMWPLSELGDLSLNVSGGVDESSEYGIRDAIRERYRNAVDRRRAANDASRKAVTKEKQRQRDKRDQREDDLAAGRAARKSAKKSSPMAEGN